MGLIPATSPSVPNWTLVTSSAPTGVATVTYSGLSGYSKYRVMAPNLICTVGNSTLQLRINADSGANYFSTSGIITSTPIGSSTNGVTQISLGSVGTTAIGLITADIEGALLSAPKQISGVAGTVNPGYQTLTGIHLNNSPITSITLLLATNNFSTGTIYILGAN